MFRRKRSQTQPPTNSPYQEKRQKEIDHFRKVANIHDLPDIYHYWSNKYLSPRLRELGIADIDHFFVKNLLDGASSDFQFLSLGSGNCDTEIRLVKKFLEQGVDSVTIECLEMNPYLLERAEALAREESVSKHVIFSEIDLNSWAPKQQYSGVLANHSLHHLVELETIFRNTRLALRPGANFVVNDMIGRNGHQRWPEALRLVETYWERLPMSHRYNHQLQRVDVDFVNWDCSVEGFEGVRAQDILPLLIETFSFRFFYGFANVISPFIDRGYGHNFDPSRNWDCSFIDEVHETDEHGFMTGVLKPTQILAVLTADKVEDCISVRGLTPEFSVRQPD